MISLLETSACRRCGVEFLMPLLLAALLCVPAPAGAGDADHDVIYVVRRGWHIDVGFAASDLRPPLSALAP